MAITKASDILGLKEAIAAAGGGGSKEIIPRINIVNQRGYQGFTVNYYANKDDEEPTETLSFDYSAYNIATIISNYHDTGFSLHGDAGGSGNVTMTMNDAIGIFKGSYYFEKDNNILLFSGNDDASVDIYTKGIF